MSVKFIVRGKDEDGNTQYWLSDGKGATYRRHDDYLFLNVSEDEQVADEFSSKRFIAVSENI